MVFQHELDHLDGIVYTEKALPRSLSHVSQIGSSTLRDAIRREVLRDVQGMDVPQAREQEEERDADEDACDEDGFFF